MPRDRNITRTEVVAEVFTVWRTQCGERILEGAEARAFAESLASLLDNAIVDQFEDYESDVVCFDNLTYGQKISFLTTIGNGLYRKDVAPVDLTAVVEGAIGAVFQHLKYMIVFEIEMSEAGTDWRELVVAARKEAGIEDVLAATCTDVDEWELEVEGLSDRILWDRDYEEDHIYVDHAPEKTQFLKYMARIPDNYYTAIADDLTDKEAAATIKELKKLCDSIIKY
ncbi:hypothetical protein ACFL6U_06875 [Planctomycetota bacterium]